MRSSILKTPALAMAAALGIFAVSGQAMAQQPNPGQQQHQQAQQSQSSCRAILTPSTLSAPSQSAQNQQSQQTQQRIAGTMTVQARLTKDIGKISDVSVQDDSGIKASLSKDENQGQMKSQQDQQQQQNDYSQQNNQTVPVKLDVSNAKEGSWKVTFKGQNDQQCTGTVRVRSSSK